MGKAHRNLHIKKEENISAEQQQSNETVLLRKIWLDRCVAEHFFSIFVY
jgi:hypothetical protein